MLEEATDRMEDVADVLQRVVIRMADAVFVLTILIIALALVFDTSTAFTTQLILSRQWSRPCF